MPNEAFFHQNPKLLGLGRQFGRIDFGGIWGIFRQIISTHFRALSPLSMFSIAQSLFLQKLSLFIQIQNIYLGLGFGQKKKGI